MKRKTLALLAILILLVTLAGPVMGDGPHAKRACTYMPLVLNFDERAKE